MAIFARDIIGRDVVDSHGQRLGELKDITFDIATGAILTLKVRVEGDIDPSKLPWIMADGLMNIPSNDISRIASKIHLKR
jgi:sporulation protein YlmC with PRC-barrel domain